MCNSRVLTMVVLLLCSVAAGQSVDWPVYGHDGGGSRYSPLTQITPENIRGLKVAWEYHTGDISDGTKHPRASGLEVTPIVVDGTMFLCSAFDRVIALDAATGRQLWTYDPKIDLDRWYGDALICRGVATWPAEPTRSSPRFSDNQRRVFVATLDGRLVSIDTATGRPDPNFGDRGQVNLTAGIRINQNNRGEYHMTSAPAVIGDLVVVGSSIDDNDRTDMPSGTVRAYDVHTGSLRWKWDPIPRDPADPAHRFWRPADLAATGAGNAWSTMSVDPDRGLIFVPTGSASPDFYGGKRIGNNVYANSVVALHAKTGTVAWYFQMVHHDLWDYDVSSQPTLLDVPVGETSVPAVVAVNKTGNIYFLDRNSGKPIFPAVERPVPQTDVPGEQTAATQPFPTTPALVPQKLTPDDAWGANEADRKWCHDTIAGLRSEGIFTPPSLKGSIHVPGNIGGVAWGGVASDPQHAMIFVNTNRLPVIVRLLPRSDIEAYSKAHLDWETSPQKGTPFGMSRHFLMSPTKLPCNAPPWGTLTAVDVRTGRVRWETPLGRWPFSPPQPESRGSINLAGPMVTASGIIFDGATADNDFRAFDEWTGKLLWKATLPFTSPATPMTYSVNGKQYVVIASGGHPKLPLPHGDAVVAFALP